MFVSTKSGKLPWLFHYETKIRNMSECIQTLLFVFRQCQTWAVAISVTGVTGSKPVLRIPFVSGVLKKERIIISPH